MRRILVAMMATAMAWAGGSGTVTVGAHRFKAEVAVEPKEQEKGLMERRELAQDRCMIFLYKEDGNHSIWMKNCYIYLDVAWVSADGAVVELVEDAEPCHSLTRQYPNCPIYGGNELARNFIEFPRGTIKRLGLKKGDKIGWDLKLANGSAVKGGVGAKAEAKKGR